ncbi:MAG: carbon-nitrogen family hydrolase [Phycisphaeraceae bacterium]|nr:carbon-nitrogen family hydrolase [Phycisphaeraceae bacterium]
MRAHLVQLDIAWEDRDENVRRVRALLQTAGVAAGDLIVLPEMFDSGFSLNTEATADNQSLTLDAISDLARRFGAFVQGGRTVLQPGADHATNRAPISDPSGAIIAEYAKIHPFSFGREGERFVGGTEIVTFRWAAPLGSAGTALALTVAPAICYDLRFPELFRLAVLRGAQAFTIGANWPAARQAHWRALLVARAIENQAFVLAVNRTGDDPHLSYEGGSIAIDPRGEVLGELQHEHAVLSVQIDPDRVRRWREAFRALDDIRLIPASERH